MYSFLETHQYLSLTAYSPFLPSSYLFLHGLILPFFLYTEGASFRWLSIQCFDDADSLIVFSASLLVFQHRVIFGPQYSVLFLNLNADMWVADVYSPFGSTELGSLLDHCFIFTLFLFVFLLRPSEGFVILTPSSQWSHALGKWPSGRKVKATARIWCWRESRRKKKTRLKWRTVADATKCIYLYLSAFHGCTRAREISQPVDGRHAFGSLDHGWSCIKSDTHTPLTKVCGLLP